MIDPNAFIDDECRACLFVRGVRLLGVVGLKGAILDNRSHSVRDSIAEFKGQPCVFYHTKGPDNRERLVCVEPRFHHEDDTIRPVKMSPRGNAPKP